MRRGRGGSGGGGGSVRRGGLRVECGRRVRATLACAERHREGEGRGRRREGRASERAELRQAKARGPTNRAANGSGEETKRQIGRQSDSRSEANAEWTGIPDAPTFDSDVETITGRPALSTVLTIVSASVPQCLPRHDAISFRKVQQTPLCVHRIEVRSRTSCVLSDITVAGLRKHPCTRPRVWLSSELRIADDVSPGGGPHFRICLLRPLRAPFCATEISR